MAFFVHVSLKDFFICLIGAGMGLRSFFSANCSYLPHESQFQAVLFFVSGYWFIVPPHLHCRILFLLIPLW